MASGGIEGFYRQKKRKPAGEFKPSASAFTKRSGKTAGGATDGAAKGNTVGADGPVHSPALLAHGSFYDLQSEYSDEEEKLRAFDMDMRFGPSLGLSRLQRLERAANMGLKPPPGIGDILLRNPAMECLWEGRV